MQLSRCGADWRSFSSKVISDCIPPIQLDVSQNLMDITVEELSVPSSFV
jgi:hypothetical protein